MKPELTTLAGGCFWGVEELFRQLDGVVKTTVGYTGGHTKNPTYDTVKNGNTGHAEAIQIKFDSDVISFSELLSFFFTMHDPTTLNQQGNDLGSQYRSEIFAHDDNQKSIAKLVIEQVNKSGQWPNPVVTQISCFNQFYSAEDYHQKYLQKNTDGYTCHFIRK